jgi:hypothetical protein
MSVGEMVDGKTEPHVVETKLQRAPHDYVVNVVN